MRLSLPSAVRRALPALLVVWAVALVGLAVLDWARYGAFLGIVVLAR